MVANGQWFGAAGPYEKIIGTVFFELDPADPHNKAIVDIDLAPRTRAAASSSPPIFSSWRRKIRRARPAACCSKSRIAAARAF